MSKNAGVFLVLFAAMLWGTTGTAQAFAPSEANPLIIGALRLAVGGGALLLFVCLKGKLKKGNWPLLITGIGGISMAAYQPLFFSAVSMSGVAVGTVVAIGSAPILAGLLEVFIYKKMPKIQWWFATMIGISGVLLLFNPFQSESFNGVGIFMAIGAGLSFAVYTLVSKQLLQSQNSEAVVGVIFFLAALLLLPIFFFFPLQWILEVGGFITILHLGLLATALAYLLFSKGLNDLPASHAVTLSLAEPLTAACLGVFLLKETLTFTNTIGIALVFMGLILLTVRKRARNEEDVKQVI
ncbi:DMT family transporter [Salirhabdus salicampi]|uniref:DMT family transporter n=1 Tax=Salirhabdus salicampi TaxID=476102 RepID=UPI0020C45FA4|nr:EamA family transporter [Salirhabdus salicampi]MCP8615446.1 DMT family transporter [Salirhabdus salicampi]